jgi:hypothetical protein
MKNQGRMGSRLAYAVLLLLSLVALVAQGQLLKLDIRVLNTEGNYVMTDVQVKEITSEGAEVLRTFQTKKGKIIIPLELGKKYMIHFWAPNKEFRSVLVDCSDKSLNIEKTYSFGFDITLPDELPPPMVSKDLVAMIWISYGSVQYKLMN